MDRRGENTSKYIKLKLVRMTPEIMQNLEEQGLVYRLCPGHDELEAKEGETLVRTIYSSEEAFGPHKLITVTVNRGELALFHTHSDNEELLLIGDPKAKPLYLVVALCSKHELESRIKDGILSDHDFIAIEAKYNDPKASFFTILKNVPHGEAASRKNGKPPSFYVTESRDIDIEITDLGDYHLDIEED